MFNRNKPWPKASFWFDKKEYQWSGWFGCQLESWEWRTFPAGTTRTLIFDFNHKVKITIFSTYRQGLKVRTTWSVCKTGTNEEYTSRIYSLQNKLKSII